MNSKFEQATKKAMANSLKESDDAEYTLTAEEHTAQHALAESVQDAAIQISSSSSMELNQTKPIAQSTDDDDNNNNNNNNNNNTPLGRKRKQPLSTGK